MSGDAYKAAGVDVGAGDRFVEQIQEFVRSTYTGDHVAHPSRYAGLFRLPTAGMGEPLLAVSCDGVGTKLKLAQLAQSYRGLGQDLVAMSVNDLLPLGAKPLLFLDYLACGKLDPEVLTEVVAGVAMACREVGCVLAGGETAEMPGVYSEQDFDLAGFAVGIVDGETLPRSESMALGDRLLALPSSGVHSNGYSLVRKVFDLEHVEPALLKALLAPTELYVNPVLATYAQTPFKAAAHITGGGLFGRLQKLAPEGLSCHLRRGAWPEPEVFAAIREAGGLDDQAMLNTFNMGLGFVAVFSAEAAKQALAAGQGWLEVGELTARNDVVVGWAA